MKKIVLIGGGGHAKSVVDTLDAAGEYEIAGFVDRQARTYGYRGYEVIGSDEDLGRLYDAGIHYAFLAIGFLGKSRVRDQCIQKLRDIGFQIPVVIDPSAVVARDARIEEGVFIGKRAVVNAAAFVGKHAILNTGAIVEHDCVVGAYSHVAVSSVLCGNVTLGSHCLIGAGSIILQGVQIGEDVRVGAGSTIRTGLADGVLAYTKKIVACVGPDTERDCQGE